MKGTVLSLLCAILFAQGRQLLSKDGRLLCNCNPGETVNICAVNSDGNLVAHEKCEKFYTCANGRPVALSCPAGLLYNIVAEVCDWPQNVDCGHRTIGDNSKEDNEKTCICNPDDAPGICAADGSDGILVPHENCNKFYKCSYGKPVAIACPGNLLYNPYTEQCDWPENVDCADRVIPDCEDGDSNDSENDGDGGDSDNGVGGGDGDNGAGGGGCNCNPGEAPDICAADGSDGVLVAHENCNKFYKCSYGKPVAIACPGNLLYNPYTEQCDWPENVDCGDRVIPDCEDGDSNDSENDGDGGDSDNGVGGGDGDNGAGGGGCNCNPGEAPDICAADGSDGVLVAHENCNKFYKCSYGKPVAIACPGNLLYNPYTEQCDWPENVDCGDRVIPDCEDGDSNDSENDGDSGDSDNGVGGGDGDNGAGGGGCNCNPGEAPEICAADGSDGVLVAHENCNKFYKCSYGKPVAIACPGNLLYNPYTEQCDWPENVDCGDRVIPDCEDGDSNDSENDGDGGDSDNGVGGGDDDNGAGGGGCNCNPGEAPEICAADGSDGVLVAHENCNKFYKCSYGKPVAIACPGNLLYNPYTEQCDWPENVDCGDRVIPDCEDGDSNDGENDGDGGDSDNGVGGGDGDNGAGGGGCNCNPGEAPEICAADGSDGVLVAHENCNKFYKCSYGKPVAIACPGNLLYNPYTEQCDWPENVDCGDRVIPDCEDGDSNDSENDGDGGDSDNGVGGGDDDNGAGGGGCNCNPGEAPEICAADGSDGVLVAHENCNKFYKCSYGKPVAIACPGNLLYNPYTEHCDWPENVDCGDRVIPDCEDGDSNDSENDGDGGDSDNGVGGGDGDNGAGGGGCNCNPGEAPEICAADGSDGVLVAHENCNKFYKCSDGKPVAMACPGNLLYNPYTEQCDWPENVDCADRVIPDCEDGDSNDSENDGDGGDSDNGVGGGDGDNGAGGGGCNCNPGEAPDICAADGSDGVLVAHENCNKFYKCSYGKPVAIACPGNLLFNPYSEQCDWPENVDCGDRVIPDCDDGDSNDGENDNGNGDEGSENDVGGGDSDNGTDGEDSDDDTDCENGDNGVDSEDNDNGNDGGDCNCNPGEAPGICAANDSDGVLVAHKNCNQFYKCANGKPVPLNCPGNLLYNPYTKHCDWPENVDCGDRVIADCEDVENEADGGNNDNDVSDEDDDNGAGGGSCNCNPGEAPDICAVDGSDGVLVAHENCNQFYKCSYGKPIALICPGNLLYNPHTEQCDWPDNVDCGDRVIPDGNDGDSGVNDNGNNGDNDGGDSEDCDDDNNAGNDDPSQAPDICATPDSDGVLVAHEECDKFYMCNGGIPIALNCPSNLLFNPAINSCDWPRNVDCGNRTVPDNGNDNDDCHCDPRMAPSLCAREGSDGMLIAHENCNQYYTCVNGATIARSCPMHLFYNPRKEVCDWPVNVDCDSRLMPTPHPSLNKHLEARRAVRV